MTTIKKAVISVYDKKGITKLAKGLGELGVEILSTGGTAKRLRDGGAKVTEISDYTGFPEILGGRVKTLHPKIHGGLLGIRDDERHSEEMAENSIEPIDMLVVNFYPFEEVAAKEGTSFSEAMENIDIGGPAMLRAAAKNHASVTVLTDPADYGTVLRELRKNKGTISPETNFRLSAKAFSYVSRYDAAISNYLSSVEPGGARNTLPGTYTLYLEKKFDLRYGENPHQRGAFYTESGIGDACCVANARQLQGKELSLNNIYDTDSAFELVREFSDTACVIVKHNNPCGAALGATPAEAFSRARECDPESAFGGIIAFNREVDETAAEEVASMFAEVIIAPGFSEKALMLLSARKNLRVLLTGGMGIGGAGSWDIKKVTGGALIQQSDRDWGDDFSDIKIPTKRKPTEEEMADLRFAWKVCRHTKSNAIVYARDRRTVGIGAGQMSRVDSVRIAGMKARTPTDGSVLASDAFFPFRDGVDEAARVGITAIAQPGGSIRDKEVIAAADEHSMAMVLTGKRHFKH
ncbi:MAG: bifunctional phosphoribosylaminoimidazolecarboxamide formyltransferase/IMP cyclohydrolase [Candidatus Dadabacteria bacterium]|nr:bifunctional phosphoribosylaminoimidazolecarboxamide formyltransferase/IMP cyclohydrolase [Candidatus Dadabacteria bacterium]MYA48752.1 bifunctional phosphoribosylaminoimidazolecarboxamide formyltransferase/IMP cyclohydrolase [Candidatus Dadabacteria bacterium]MYG82495.1 bifunctional phosphoribosylaminoimidazolecarboxamide formyltransferase/IMP cyclohydrolase [Candidatus Dadabacteria bacterium]